MVGYWLTFGGSAVICTALHFYSSSLKEKKKHEITNSNNNNNNNNSDDVANQATTRKSTEFKSFQQSYLTVYYLAMFADWLQGPYVYALYASHGYSSAEIAYLFVAGFASSMIFGTITGSLCDRLGRRNMCFTYAILYSLSAFTKTMSSWYILLLGRLFSGVATSLLYCAFESWMVSEHNRRGFSPDLLSETFSKATIGNGLSAVIAGLVASFLADNFSVKAPFLFCIIPLLIQAFLVTKWDENYGTIDKDAPSALVTGFEYLKNQPYLALFGLAQALFDGSMYIFVFNWSPVLIEAVKISKDSILGSNNDGKILGTDVTTSVEDTVPFGVIFAAFMVAVMIGSYVFKMYTISKTALQFPIYIHTVAFACFIIVATSTSVPVLTLTFLTFEACCGAFWPSYGTIRSKYIPEHIRASVSSLFRVPLNLFVLTLLLNAKTLSPGNMFFLCAGAQVMALVFFSLFQRNAKYIQNDKEN